ncbi:MAG: gfo/Idh/MocA family oxidoreductase [Clostridia bacterium]|nr:gfo/Idh/MocA family oxidoreductase [Clostridia bacterium]
MKKVRLSVIGAGSRGTGLTKILARMPDVEIVNICDIVEDRALKSRENVREIAGYQPAVLTDWHEALEAPGLDGVIAATPWFLHIPVSVAAMKKGIRPGSEVGAAFDVNDCWKLIDTYEETGVPAMLLENRCWNRDALLVAALAKAGLFGEIVSCTMGYMHDLRHQVGGDGDPNHGRVKEYLHRNCNNYATHPLGPCAHLLGVNRGNRITSLVAVASRARGMADYVARHPGHPLTGCTWEQGDITTVILTLAHGETIHLTLDTTLPRRYSHGYFVHGTRGMFNGETREVFIEGMHDESGPIAYNNLDSFRDEYECELWKHYNPDEEGHGGIDYLCLRAYVDSVKNHTEPPIDVYDMATWKSISPLSEQSIAHGGMPVAVPDFTRGLWMRRENVHPTLR